MDELGKGRGSVGWKYWLKKWPVRLSLVVALFNVEFVVIPLILVGLLGLVDTVLRFTAAIWSTVEMSYWIWFSNWLDGEAQKVPSVSKVINVSQEVVSEIVDDVKDRGYISISPSIDKILKEHSVDNFYYGNYQNNQIFKLLVSLMISLGHILSCVLIFFLSLLPTIWILGLMLCQVPKKISGRIWKMGYISLLVGNFIKNYSFAYVWEHFGFMWYLLILGLGAMGFIFWFVKGLLKSRKKKNHS